MSAQLIYIHSLEQEAGSEDTKAGEGKPLEGKGAPKGGGPVASPGTGSEGGTGSSGHPGTSKFPPWYPLPTGTFKVFGQKAVHIGHFGSMPVLLKAVKSKTLPGGSNTFFATVEDIGELDPKSFKKELADLPEELTIIVSPKV